MVNISSYSAEFKATVAREAMRESATLEELASRFNVSPNAVAQWKRQALDGLIYVFANDSRSKRRAEPPQSLQRVEMTREEIDFFRSHLKIQDRKLEK